VGIRPLALITLGIVAFGFIMDRFGMGLALFALFFLSALGATSSSSRKWRCSSW